MWLILPLLASGCLDGLAERSVKAPNLQQHKWRLHTLHPDVLATLEDARQLDISVGPPEAKVHVWVSEPLASQTMSADIQVLGLIQRVRMKRLPATQPVQRAPRPRGTIVLLHGISDRQELDPYVLYKELWRVKGYRVVQVDLRGHGRSTGEWISYGVFESKDMVQVLDELAKQGLVTGPVGVMGFSYGGAVGIKWAAIDPRVKAVVAIEPYATLEEVAQDASWIFLGPLRHFFSDDWFRKGLARAGELAGFDPAEASPLAAIRMSETPVLLIHSRSDELTPFRHSEQLHAAAPNHSRLMALDGQSHFTIWAKALEPIMKASGDWFATYLAAGGP